MKDLFTGQIIRVNNIDFVVVDVYTTPKENNGDLFVLVSIKDLDLFKKLFCTSSKKIENYFRIYFHKYPLNLIEVKKRIHSKMIESDDLFWSK